MWCCVGTALYFKDISAQVFQFNTVQQPQSEQLSTQTKTAAVLTKKWTFEQGSNYSLLPVMNNYYY